jgi:endonuclease YncB( thermonuclease family)
MFGGGRREDAMAVAAKSSFRQSLLSGFGLISPAAQLEAALGRVGVLGAREKALANGARPYGDPAEHGKSLTKGEARRRIPELVSGAFKVRSVGELVDYLKHNLLDLQVVRFGGSSRGTTYLRDAATGARIAAAPVHPSLSAKGLNKLAGRDMATDGPRPPTPEEMRDRDTLKIKYRGQAPGYANYESLLVGISTALGKGYTVSAGVAYVGKAGRDPRRPLACIDTPEKTRALLYAYLADDASRRGFQAKPIEQFLRLSPEQQTAFLARHFVFDDKMTPRTPVLLRDASLVQAARLHPQLSAERMTAKVGHGLDTYFQKLHSDQTEKRERTRGNVVDFASHLAARSAADGTAAPTAFGQRPAAPVGARKDAGIVIVIDDRYPEPRVCRYSPDGNHQEIMDYASIHDLKAGDYRLLVMDATFDRPTGWVVVDDRRGYAFQDAARREHNQDGPSYVPGPGASGDEMRWALAGKAMPEDRWLAELGLGNPRRDPRDDVGFGYGAVPR